MAFDRKAHNIKYKAANREKIRIKAKEYRERNKEKIKLLGKDWNEKNRERRNELNRLYKERHREEVMQADREYKERNRNQIREKQRVKYYSIPRPGRITRTAEEKIKIKELRNQKRLTHYHTNGGKIKDRVRTKELSAGYLKKKIKRRYPNMEITQDILDLKKIEILSARFKRSGFNLDVASQLINQLTKYFNNIHRSSL